MQAKKDPTACDDRALKAEFKNAYALNSALAYPSQSVSDALRVRRLTRAGLPIAIASILAPFAFGEARR